MKEPIWITKEAAIALHDRQLSEHGGLAGIRDEGLLESALSKPQNVFFYSDKTVDITRLAASYAYGLATNHPFLDGNKRTALAVSLTFLYLHGYKFTGSYEDEYKTIIALAAGTLTEEALADWFAANTKKA
jgi:death-on-curing protein